MGIVDVCEDFAVRLRVECVRLVAALVCGGAALAHGDTAFPIRRPAVSTEGNKGTGGSGKMRQISPTPLPPFPPV